ncbi:MAG: hypothetical protein AABZ33_01725 [Chloroflexota bacterium]|mgnify:CR=1 FL=1
MDRYPEHDRHPRGHGEPLDDIELLEDHTRKITGGRSGRRLGVSMPGAIAGAFLVTALAFGAAVRPDGAATNPASSSADEAASAASDTNSNSTIFGHAGFDNWATDGDRAGVDAKPGSESIDSKGPDASEPGDEEPTTDEPTDKPDQVVDPVTEPKPELETIGLTVSLDGSKVVIDWGACDPVGFRYYKVIRSTNDAATWPLGSGDSLVGAVEDMGKTVLYDAKAPAGTKVYYKVVAVVEYEGKLIPACVSPLRGIVTKPAPTDTPDAGTLGLELAIVEGHPKVRWTECPGTFDYYKIVRSTDSTVTWPAGDNDKVVGVVGRDGGTKFYDGDAPAGTKLWYRVFCVRSSESGYVVVAASAAKAIETPTFEPKPTPEPYVLGFSVTQTGEGIVLEWEARGIDGFMYYKVVRSMTNPNPTYPANDGTEVIAAIGDPATTRFVDANVQVGQTWFYRVLSIGDWGGQKVTLGITPVATLTVQ